MAKKQMIEPFRDVKITFTTTNAASIEAHKACIRVVEKFESSLADGGTVPATVTGGVQTLNQPNRVVNYAMSYSTPTYTFVIADEDTGN